MKCLGCNKKNGTLLCSRCKNNPFRVEDARHILSTRGKLKELKSLYAKSYAQITDLNTRDFWDKRIDKNTDYIPQKGMTENRVKIAYGFIPRNTKRLLDIGAGYGYVEKLISKNRKDIEIYGNDISKHAISYLNKTFKGNFKLESIHNMKYKSGFFDTVLLLEVLEHIIPAKTFKVLEDIKRILTPKGYVIISVPSNEGLELMKDNPNGHTRTYTQSLIISELKIAGFEIIEVKTLHAFSSLYSLKTFISKIFPKRWKINDIIVLARKIT